MIGVTISPINEIAICLNAAYRTRCLQNSVRRSTDIIAVSLDVTHATTNNKQWRTLSCLLADLFHSHIDHMHPAVAHVRVFLCQFLPRNVFVSGNRLIDARAALSGTEHACD